MNWFDRIENILTRTEAIQKTSRGSVPVVERSFITEIDLMIRYLEKLGTKVNDVCYYNEGMIAMAHGYSLDIGVISGYAAQKCWFFGEVNMSVTIGGVIDLGDANTLLIKFSSLIKGQYDLGSVDIYKGVNNGLNLRGDGQYQGSSRHYQMGFNKVDVTASDFGAATFVVDCAFNGYLFIM